MRGVTLRTEAVLSIDGMDSPFFFRHMGALLFIGMCAWVRSKETKLRSCLASHGFGYSRNVFNRNFENESLSLPGRTS